MARRPAGSSDADSDRSTHLLSIVRNPDVSLFSIWPVLAGRRPARWTISESDDGWGVGRLPMGFLRGAASAEDMREMPAINFRTVTLI